MLTTYKKPTLIILEEKTKISQYPDEVQLKRLVDAIDYLLNLLGVNQTSDKKDQWNALARFIKDEYSHFTFEEIAEAFKMFIKGEFETKPFQQLNAVVFGQVMNYYAEYKRIKLFDYKRNLKLKELPMITEIQKEEIVLNGLKDAFNLYKSQKKMKDVCSHYYDYLDEKGLIELTSQEKNKIYYYAKKTLEFELKDTKAITLEQRNEIKRLLEIGVPEEKIKALAKKIALKDLFENLVRKNKTIDDLINKR